MLHHDNQQSAWLMYNYWVDWEEFNLIKDVLDADDIVFDIGANIGFYTLWMSIFIKNTGKIHSFEPDEKSFARLTNNIGINQLQPYVISNQLAVADKNQLVKFSKGRDGENHILHEEELEHHLLRCITIDQYVEDHKIDKIKYIKIDIEGFEYQALLGAINTLTNKKVSILQIEINCQIQNSHSSLLDLLGFIEKIDYTLCSYDLCTKKFIPIKYSVNRENYFMVNNDLI